MSISNDSMLVDSCKQKACRIELRVEIYLEDYDDAVFAGEQAEADRLWDRVWALLNLAGAERQREVNQQLAGY